MTATLNIEVRARTEQALRNLGNLAKGAGGLSAALKDDAAGALGAFGVSLTATNQPLTLLAENLKQSVTAAANWGDEMGDLAQLTGQSVEETSKMAATFELMGIEGGQLTKVLKTLSEDGINLNMASLKELSKQYQAVQDPVAKNKFLFDKFGRAAADMAEIMGRSTEELDALAAAAGRSGKVIGGEASDAAEKFNVNLAIMQQRVEGAQIAVGNALIPALNKSLTAFDQLVTIWQMGQVKLREQRGEIDGATAALEMQRIAGIEPASEATTDLTDNTAALTAETNRWAAQAAMYQAKAEAYALAIDKATGSVSDLQFGMGELTKALVFNTAAQGLDEDAAYELAKSMGLVSKSADSAKQMLDDLRVKYDANRDGAISASEAAAGYSEEVRRLGEFVGKLEDKTVTITVKELIYSEMMDAARQKAGAIGGRDNPGIGGAAGLNFIVPPGYPNDSFGPIWAQSGEHVMIAPSINVGAINVNGANMTNAGVGTAVRAELERMGRSADTRIRTR